MSDKEFACRWTCPKCQKHQSDSVHPELGPFVTCTCTECGNSFDDDALDEISRASWERARRLAESA